MEGGAPLYQWNPVNEKKAAPLRGRLFFIPPELAYFSGDGIVIVIPTKVGRFTKRGGKNTRR
jgi:hypothetical protein